MSAKVALSSIKKAYTFLHKQGLIGANVFLNTGITESELYYQAGYVEENFARRFFHNLCRLIHRDGLGLELGWLASPADLSGKFQLELAKEDSYGGFIRNLWRLQAGYDCLTRWEYQLQDKRLIFRVRCPEINTKLRVFLIEQKLASLQAFTEEIVGSDCAPITMHLDYKVLNRAHQYSEIFRCPILSGQASVELQYPLELFKRPIKSRVEAAAPIKRDTPRRLPYADTVIADVNRVLAAYTGTPPSLGKVAEHLSQPPRVLRRRLARHYLRYQDLLDLRRARLAEQLATKSAAENAAESDTSGGANREAGGSVAKVPNIKSKAEERRDKLRVVSSRDYVSFAKDRRAP